MKFKFSGQANLLPEICNMILKTRGGPGRFQQLQSSSVFVEEAFPKLTHIAQVEDRYEIYLSSEFIKMYSSSGKPVVAIFDNPRLSNQLF